MSDFKVLRKTDGEEVLRYSAAVAQEVNGFDLVSYNHVEYVPDNPDVPPKRTVYTKLEYMRLFTHAERQLIRKVSKTNETLEDYVALLELAEEISLSDPDTIAAVNILEQYGLLASGRAQEILNG